MTSGLPLKGWPSHFVKSGNNATGAAIEIRLIIKILNKITLEAVSTTREIVTIS